MATTCTKPPVRSGRRDRAKSRNHYGMRIDDGCQECCPFSSPARRSLRMKAAIRHPDLDTAPEPSRNGALAMQAHRAGIAPQGGQITVLPDRPPSMVGTPGRDHEPVRSGPLPMRPIQNGRERRDK